MIASLDQFLFRTTDLALTVFGAPTDSQVWWPCGSQAPWGFGYVGKVTRRFLLKRVAATAIVAPAVIFGSRIRAALPTLPDLPSSDALLLRPGDAHFDDYQLAWNIRTILTPQLRALCKTSRSAGVMIDWCRSNNLPFALRSGGHCFEGLSQSSSVVIDTRQINQIKVDPATKTVTVGAGASLGDVYRRVAPLQLALPAGSCPTIGISGHVLGGGCGSLARVFGLACDNLLSIELIDPQGHQIRADARQNSDLFWACRGGGGGSFGAATAFCLQLHDVPKLFVFGIYWPDLAPSRAAKVMKDWQTWAPQAPHSIYAPLQMGRHASGRIYLYCFGYSVGSIQQLRRELRILSTSPEIASKSFLQAVNYFVGNSIDTSAQTKVKSDVNSPLSDDGLSTLMNEVSQKSGITILCEPYGGAIASTASDATAFPHRGDRLISFMYVSKWINLEDTQQRLKDMRDLYAAMRPYMSGRAYVNYCDLDLINWQSAYWGQNLTRLKQVKSAFDPDNVFQHAQSVPLA